MMVEWSCYSTLQQYKFGVWETFLRPVVEVVLGVIFKDSATAAQAKKRAEFVLLGQINLIFMLICNRMNVL